MANYKFVKEGIHHKVERLEFPKFTAYVDLSKPIPIFEKLEFSDVCSADEILQAINEACEFIKEIPT